MEILTVNQILKDIIQQPAIVVFWPLTRPKMPFQGDAPEGNDTFKWQSWEEIAWRKLADEMGWAKKNSHGILIDWCTGREWPVKCMTVIPA